VSCSGTTALPPAQNPTAVGPTTYTLLVTNEDAGGASTTAQATVNCGATLDPANIAGGGVCPVAQFYCEAAALDTTIASQAVDACNACLGASCTLTTSADGTAGVDAATGTSGAASVFYVYSNALSTADSNCTPVAYTPAAGQVYSQTADVCTSGNW
jgi:hypothetical protein